jgi:WD40 repeat protein
MNLHSPSFSLRRSYHVYFSPTGYWLAVIERGAVAVWNIEQRKRVAALKLGKVNSADFSPDEQYLVAKSTRGELVLWNWRTDEVIAEIKENDSQGTRPLFTECGGFILDGSWNGTLVVRDAKTLAICSESQSSEPVRSVDHNKATGQFLALRLDRTSPEKKNTIEFYKINEGQLELINSIPVAWKQTLARFSPSGQLICLSSGSGLEIIDIQSLQVQSIIEGESPNLASDVCWSPDETTIAACQRLRKKIAFFDARDFRELGSISVDNVSGVDYSADGKYIAVGSWTSGEGFVMTVPHLQSFLDQPIGSLDLEAS